jgi:hypothetical protein
VNHLGFLFTYPALLFTCHTTFFSLTPRLSFHLLLDSLFTYSSTLSSPTPRLSLHLPLDMAYNQLTYPPDIDCFTNGDYSGLLSNFTMNNCSITNNMVKFLNLTGQNYKPYLNAYCTSPPSNDNCPFGFCPNSDIAGLWVRIASELTPSSLRPRC